MRLNPLVLSLCGVAACAAEPVEATESLGGSTGAPSLTDGVADDGDADTAGPGESDDDGMVDSESGQPTGEPVCGNDIIDGNDVCDGTDVGVETCESLGFEIGTLGCTANCGGYDLTGCGFFECGNGKAEGDEDCDGTVGSATCASEGFDNGTLFCQPDCEYNYDQCGTCGNSLIDPEEDCDIKADLEASCFSLGFMTGNLQCGDDCLYNTDGCSTCGNDMQEGNEDCDGVDVPGKTCAGEGFDSGTLSCQDNCQYDFAACGTCGNDLRDGDELCDGPDFGADSCITEGFDSGSLTCNAACDTVTNENCGVCGNAIIDGSEACDGALLGGETCAGLGLQGGDLACDPVSCQFDFAGCDLQGMPFGSDVAYQGLSLNGVLPCDDILATGTQLMLTDDSSAVANMGFNFPFYGADFNVVNVNSNGTLNFDAAFSSLGNVCLPSPATDRMISVFWDDLNPSNAMNGGVFYETLGAPGNQRFVVQFETAHFAGDTSDLIRVQTVLHEAGNIDVCYVDTLSAGNGGDNGAQATAGIQDGTTAVQFSCNTPDLVDGLWLMYLPV